MLWAIGNWNQTQPCLCASTAEGLVVVMGGPNPNQTTLNANLGSGDEQHEVREVYSNQK